jgi:hypothetical protein
MESEGYWYAAPGCQGQTTDEIARLENRISTVCARNGIRERQPRSKYPEGESDSIDQFTRVLGYDSVGDHRTWIIGLEIEVDAVFGARTDEILNKIHASTAFQPSIIDVRIVRFDHGLVLERNVAKQGEIPEGGEPGGWIDQRISDNKSHPYLYLSAISLIRVLGLRIQGQRNVRTKLDCGLD